MKWNRQTITTLVVVLLTVVVTSFFVKFTFDHDGESLTVLDDSPSASASTGSLPDAVASGDIDPYSGLPWILEGELPVEGRATLALIDQGGPFPYPDKDGSTFQNREGVLPDEPGGYYAEYTVLTPGESDRGPRRIVAGDGGELYWTEDHYESFSRIARIAS